MTTFPRNVNCYAKMAIVRHRAGLAADPLVNDLSADDGVDGSPDVGRPSPRNMRAHSPSNEGGSRIAFLDFLRSLAIILVLWDHLVGQWLGWRRRSWLPLTLVDRFGARPLGVIQDFGWLGVSLFFLISGFIISHVALNETRLVFATKRLLRIYPPLILAVVIAMAIERVREHWSIVDSGVGVVPHAHGLGDALWSASLLNYLEVPQPIVLGVAWSLVIEMLFYCMIFVVRPLLRRRGLASWLILCLVFVGLKSLRSFGPHYFLFVVSLSYVPVLVCGQAVWLRWMKRVPTWEFVAITLVAWVEFVYGLETIQPTFLAAGNEYGPSIVIAYALFVAALLGGSHLVARRWVSYVASRSYSLYLLHGPIGLVTLDASIGHLPYTACLALAIAVTLVATELSFRLVERPSQKLARTLLVRRGSTSTAPAMKAVTPSAGHVS